MTADMIDLPGECWDALATLDAHGITAAKYQEMLRFMNGGVPINNEIAAAWDEGAEAGYQLAIREGPHSDYAAKTNPYRTPTT